MLIEGPMNISIAEPADGKGKVLVILFTPEFQALSLAGQGEVFRDYLQMLSDEIAAIDSEEDRNRAGMIIVQQFAEQLYPHITNGELALEERIVIQLRQETQAAVLVDLLGNE